jgi:hypothetical protein
MDVFVWDMRSSSWRLISLSLTSSGLGMMVIGGTVELGEEAVSSAMLNVSMWRRSRIDRIVVFDTFVILSDLEIYPNL